MAKAQYTHDIVATTGEYTNRDGEKKKEYTNVGKAFTDDQGRISLKLKCVPVGPEWSGWLSLYPAKEREPSAERPQQGGYPQQRPPAYQPQRAAPAPAAADDDDDIPF